MQVILSKVLTSISSKTFGGGEGESGGKGQTVIKVSVPVFLTTCSGMQQWNTAFAWIKLALY